MWARAVGTFRLWARRQDRERYERRVPTIGRRSLPRRRTAQGQSCLPRAHRDRSRVRRYRHESALYAFSYARATGHALPTASDVLGIVSLIFWALMAIVSLKYVVLVLRADNDGEGGILALLSLVASGANLRTAPGCPILVLLGIVGAALLYGDGVITPAISVLSAMEGLRLVAPAFEDFILPLTLAILIGLFMMQRRGTASIGRLFGPIMVSWIVVIGLLGVINIWAAPEILKALSFRRGGPLRAGKSRSSPSR